MNKKTIFTIFLLVVVYSMGYLFSFKATTPDSYALPQAGRFHCLDADTVITFGTTIGTLCKAQNSFYLLKGTNKKSVTDLLSIKATYYPGSLGYFASVMEKQVQFYRVAEGGSIQELGSFMIAKGDTIISQFIFQTKGGDTHLFLSGEHTVDSPKQPRAFLSHYTIFEDSVAVAYTFQLAELVKVSDMVEKDGELHALLRESQPFLEPKRRVLRIRKGSTPSNITCPMQQPPLFTFTVEEFCQNGSEEILFSSSQGDLVATTDRHTLTWANYQSASTTTIISEVALDSLELIARSSTRIGKRVYNCFDFTESSQITLRLCIPTI